MKLLLDQGNSRLKWRLATTAGEFVDGGVADGHDLPPEQMARIRVRAVSGLSGAAIGSVLASVHQQALVAALQAHFGLTPVLMKSVAECAGLRNGYYEPERLGIDRWLAMLGARTHGAGAWLVVDAGTAMTIDAISSAGVHLGGYIVPGYRLQQSMLTARTAGVGEVVREAGTVWGRDTSAAVSRGVLLSLAALVDRTSVELARAGDDTCRVIVTGGDAALLAPHLHGSPQLDPDLLFRGMLVGLSEAHRGPG